MMNRREETMAIPHIPAGHHTVAPYLVVPDADALILFMERAFDAVETERAARPDGTVMHAEVRIGDSMVMLGETPPDGRPWPAMIHLYVPDVDAVYGRALEAGATSLREPENTYYGDRSAGVEDRHGNQWWIATHVEDVPSDELARRREVLAREQSGT